MPRIRTIKPEFPQSESMGRVSREARLLFVLLWTICDDSGRARAASRMLASLLYPYDDDAPKKIDLWITELEREECVIRYQAEGATYLQVCNWLNHQKIDKPSASKIPAFDESSRSLAKPREHSSGDLRTKGPKDQGREWTGTDGRKRPSRRCPEEWTPGPAELEWAAKECPGVQAQTETAKFKDHTFATARTDWAATWRNWIRRATPTRPVPVKRVEPTPEAISAARREAAEANRRELAKKIGGIGVAQ
jgi:hypothetical protein